MTATDLTAENRSDENLYFSDKLAYTLKPQARAQTKKASAEAAARLTLSQKMQKNNPAMNNYNGAHRV